MALLDFLLIHWDSVLVVLAVLVGIVALLVTKQSAILDKIIFALVTEAEKQYGGGTGALKLAVVVNWVYPKIPSIIRLFLSEKQLVAAINRVLEEAKRRWESNPGITSYIATGDASAGGD